MKRLTKKAGMPNYGGIPSEGGFGKDTFFEVGIGIIAEAAHCILGVVAGAANSQLSMEDALEVCQQHVYEELGIIQRTLNEYSANTKYIDEFYAQDENYKKEVKNKAKQLKDLANSMSKQLKGTCPDELIEVAQLSYSVIEKLASEVSVEISFNQFGNPFNFRVKKVVDELSIAIDKLYSTK